MIDDARVHELVGLLYDAAQDPGRWSGFLGRLSETLGAPAALIFHQDLHDQNGAVAAGVGLAPEQERDYAAYYAQRNTWLVRGRDKIVSGVVLTGEMMCSDDVLLASEYYSDYLRRWDLGHMIGGNVAAEGTRTTNCTLLRSRRAGPFGAEAMAVMRALVPHLQRAFAIHRRLQACGGERAALLATLDCLPYGVVLTGPDATPLVVNRAGQAILARRDGITSERDGLRAATPRATALLRALVADAAGTAARGGGAGGGVITLERGSGRSALQLLVAPLTVGADDGRPPLAAVFITDPEAEAATPARALMAMYGLTPAEARVAAGLLSGRSTDELAGELTISMNTLRTHLKRVLDKTGARSQADLVRLLLRSPAALALAG